ncbi:antibiotic biosynthesis monooxygenase family protein [Deinococcus apachensis]|uniref:antibiotic biosynthesis monooxygenase family protein n=1 Tax=Deinococcus apachensis TaxID=309886 RepID=UPI000378DC3D|nr:antibiotic biosynthesis monooxygenase family protein [Deinococcus apachensis]
MHARIVTVQIRPGKMSGAVLIYRDVVAPLLARQPGFAGARLLTDARSGRGVLLTLWESEAALQAAEASGLFQEEIARFQPVLGAPPSGEDYEVSVTV